MHTNHPNYVKAKDLLKIYVDSNHKFEERYATLYESICNYIEKSDYSEKANVNELLLGYTLVDYFEDVRRLKVFHQVDHINSIKIVSYTSYWLLRRKPIQIISLDKDVLYINEKFVLAYILEFLSNQTKKHILDRNEYGLESFSKSLFYYLKYRFLNAQSIEMIIMSFFAGQVYQENGVDLSFTLPTGDDNSH